jgi:hypothetical protein
VTQAEVKKEKVKVWTLRTFLKKAGLDHVDLLKLDIEGAELDMLEASSREDLQRISQISIEFHDFLFKNQKRRVKEAIQKLINNNFYMIRISRDNTDVLFVNRNNFYLSELKLAFIKWPYKYTIGVMRRLNRMYTRYKMA